MSAVMLSYSVRHAPLFLWLIVSRYKEEECTMHEWFISDLIAAKYKHLTPRSKNPCEPSLELLASLYRDEQKRTKKDIKTLKRTALLCSFLPVLILVIGVEMLDSVLMTDGLIAAVTMTIMASLLLVMSVMFTHPGLVEVSASERAEEYHKRIKLFWNDIIDLATVLDFSTPGTLSRMSRKMIAELGLARGASFCSVIRGHAILDNVPTHLQANIAKANLFFLHKTLERFGLEPKGGDSVYWRYSPPAPKQYTYLSPRTGAGTGI